MTQAQRAIAYLTDWFARPDAQLTVQQLADAQALLEAPLRPMQSHLELKIRTGDEQGNERRDRSSV